MQRGRRARYDLHVVFEVAGPAAAETLAGRTVEGILGVAQRHPELIACCGGLAELALDPVAEADRESGVARGRVGGLHGVERVGAAGAGAAVAIGGAEPGVLHVNEINPGGEGGQP